MAVGARDASVEFIDRSSCGTGTSASGQPNGRRNETSAAALPGRSFFGPSARPEPDVVLNRGCVRGRGRPVSAWTSEEVDQRRVDLLWVRPADVVRAVGDLDDGQVVDQSLVAQSSGCGR